MVHISYTMASRVYVIWGVSNLWNGLWNGLMEWTDGMEYQLTKRAKIHYCGHSKVVSTVLPLLAQLDCYV